MPTSRDKIVVCFSGGYDSVALVEMLKREFDNEDIHLLYFEMGQKGLIPESRRVKAFVQRADNVGMTFRTVPLYTAHMPVHPERPGDAYYPMRNLVFLAHAVSYADAIGAGHVGMGFVGFGEYPDADMKFSSLFDALSFMTAGISLVKPFEGYSKMQVAKQFLEPHGGKELVVRTLHASYSCNFPDPYDRTPCGECADCRERREIYEEYGLTPIATPPASRL